MFIFKDDAAEKKKTDEPTPDDNEEEKETKEDDVNDKASNDAEVEVNINHIEMTVNLVSALLLYSFLYVASGN